LRERDEGEKRGGGNPGDEKGGHQPGEVDEKIADREKKSTHGCKEAEYPSRGGDSDVVVEDGSSLFQAGKGDEAKGSEGGRIVELSKDEVDDLEREEGAKGRILEKKKNVEIRSATSD